MRLNLLAGLARGSRNFSVVANKSISKNRNSFINNAQNSRVLYRFYCLPSHEKIYMPALSPTMTQGNIAKWVAKEGQQLESGDVINEIETDKATMEFEVSEDGYLAKIVVPEGSKDVPVGNLLCIMVESESDVAAFANYVDDGAAQTEATPAEPAPTPTPAPAPAPAPTPAPTPTPTPTTTPASSGERIFASPFARKLASSMGIDLNTVSGSGPNGRIVENDILNAVKTTGVPASSPASSPSSSPALAATTTGAATDIDLSNMRKVIADRLLESKTTIPHYYLTSEINLDNLISLRGEFNNNPDFKLSVNDFVVKASALACKSVPECNSAWMGSFIRQYNNVDVCVAVSTDKGLITPIIPSAEQKGLKSISTMTKDLANRAREGKLQPSEYQGGTFTVSNLGMFGVNNFSAIINPPQACILAVGGSEKKVLVDSEGGFYVGNTMKVTLSCDHRVVDGAVGAQWLKAFKTYLEDPKTMLL